MIKQITWNHQTTYLLTNDTISIWINPSDGMNLYEIKHLGEPLIKFYENRLLENKTCSVMTLFPTPNRIRNGVFAFEGTTYAGSNHGIVKHANFSVTKVIETKEGGSLEGTLVLRNTPNDVSYQAFPFACTLTLMITLEGNKIIYSYSLCNQDMKALPYGLAIHPFFEKQDKEVKIQVFANSYMEQEEDKLPTGKLLPAINQYNLREGVNVNTLQLDHVYTDLTKQPCVVIEYPDKKVTLSATEEFKKLVVFTPEHSPFFCLENQTCSTDAINMHSKGFVEEASLLILKPTETKRGSIELEIVSFD